MHNFLGDTNLLLELLSGVGMVGIDDSRLVDNVHLVVHFVQTD